MIIVTPKQLWTQYNRFTPIQESIISANEYEKKLYFNGYKSESCVVRVYARLLINQQIPNAPVIIVAHSFNKDIDTIDPNPFLNLGYSVLFVDYAGKNPNKSHYTHYPKSLNADWENDINVLKNPVADVKNSSWYYFTTCIIHAVTYLESCDNIDSKNIGIIGIEEGAGLVYKCSLVLNEIKAGATFFCSDIANSSDEAYLAYKTALDSKAYGMDCFPVLINAASNESNGGLDYLSELHQGTKNSLLSIYEKAEKSISTGQINNLKIWFDNYFYNNDLKIEKPQLNLFCSEGVLYLELTTIGENINIFVSFTDNPAFRNWNKIKFSKAGDNKYLAKIDVFDINCNVYAFCNVTINNLAVSSPLICANPIKLGVKEEEKQSKTRLLYQSDNGIDCFMAQEGEIFKNKLLEVKEGPLGLNGVCGDCLITLKPNEKRYRGSADNLLQIILFSPITQEVDFFITVYNDELRELKEFNEKRKILGGNWSTINLSDEDFKSLLGSPSFDKVIKIAVKGQEIIINSIIWI